MEKQKGASQGLWRGRLWGSRKTSAVRTMGWMGKDLESLNVFKILHVLKKKNKAMTQDLGELLLDPLASFHLVSRCKGPSFDWRSSTAVA